MRTNCPQFHKAIPMSVFSKIFSVSNSPEIAIRRDLHKYPETAFLEYRTASLVAETLDDLGYAVRTGKQVMDASALVNPPSAEVEAEAVASALANGGVASWIERMRGGLTAVVGEKSFGPGPVLAFRFDMDALTLVEADASDHAPRAQGFASTDPERMHGCGHDGHVAIGLSVARALAETEALSGTLRFIFQPAEEGGRGAAPIIAAGLLDDVDYLFVAHLGCFLGSGKVAPDACDFLHSTKFEVEFRGRSSHAAMAPQDGRNALLAGASAATALHGITRIAGEETFVNVGKLMAGTTFNIIADTCEMLVEVRAQTAEGHAAMIKRAEAVINGAAQMQDVEHSTRIVSQLNGNTNHREALDIVGRAAGSLPGIEVVDSWPIGGGDDASKMIARVHERGGKAAYFLVGSDITAPHHAQEFDFDEASLTTARQVFENIARLVLGE